MDVESLVNKISESEGEVFWFGSSSTEAIAQLESLLDLRLPKSFSKFLSICGGGGFATTEISGIEEDNPSLQHRGTVYGDTIRCRDEAQLPNHLVVIYFDPEDVIWCLDTSKFTGNECPVVSYDEFHGGTSHIADNFTEFLAEYYQLRTS